MVPLAINETIVQRKLVAVVLLRRSIIHHLLPDLLAALPNSLDAEKTAGFPVYKSHDEDLVFF